MLKSLRLPSPASVLLLHVTAHIVTAHVVTAHAGIWGGHGAEAVERVRAAAASHQQVAVLKNIIFVILFLYYLKVHMFPAFFLLLKTYFENYVIDIHYYCTILFKNLYTVYRSGKKHFKSMKLSQIIPIPLFL